MRIFLQGRSGAGKSTALRQVLAPYAACIAGLSTQRLVDKNGAQVGFRATLIAGDFPPLQARCPDQPDGVFILRGKTDTAALERAIGQVEELLAQPHMRLALLDEIGGIEAVY